MRLVWHQRPHLERKLDLAHAIAEGLPDGDTLRIVDGFDGVDEQADALVLFGIGGMAKQVWDAYEGKRRVLVDKGYTRKTGHWRVSVNAFQPLAYLKQGRSPDRFVELGVELRRQRTGYEILFDGASQKYCDWQGLGRLEEWGAAVVQKIRAHSHRRIIYRPRPTHNEAIAVPGAELSTESLGEDLSRAHVIVSYGGNIGWDAVVAGAPHFAIGDSIAGPLSETDWTRLGRQRFPTQAEREQWCADVAYCQWTLDEFKSGEAWRHIRPWI